MAGHTPAVFERLDLFESQTCQRLAVLSGRRPLLATLRLASRLGDWPAWAALTLCLPLWHGRPGWWLALQFALTAGSGALLYRLLKTRLCRERPFVTFTAIPCTLAPLDRYSFPSGHTLHAVSFCTLTASAVPWLLVVVAPLTLLIAASRVGLGLHYLSDIAAGALLGLLLATISLWLWPLVITT